MAVLYLRNNVRYAELITASMLLHPDACNTVLSGLYKHAAVQISVHVTIIGF